jgi:hypothetical protein
MTVTDKQLEYEFNHLQKKLKERDKLQHLNNFVTFQRDNRQIKANPIFKVTKGGIESWEKIK